MVKANVIPGKFLSFLLGILVGIILLVGGIVGVGYYAYKNVKVDKILSLIPGENEWLSPDYAENTVEDFIKEISDLKGDSLTIKKFTEISPYLGEKLDELIAKVGDTGIVSLDKETLYSTPLSSLSSSLGDVLIISASLNSLGNQFGFSLPDMPLIKGGVDIYTAVNDNEDKKIEKAIELGDYTYYTLSYFYDEKATELTETNTYVLEGVEVDDGGYLKVNGKFVYLRTEIADADDRYEKVKATNGNIISYEDSSYVFTTDELYYKNDLDESDEYGKYVTIEGASTQIYKVPQKYEYRHLYAKDGDDIILATKENADGYIVLDAYKNQDLYLQTEVYTPVEELTDDIKNNNVLYVRTSGIGDLPITMAISALSNALDMNALSLNQVSEYFGVTLENDMLDDVMDVPMGYLSGAMNSIINDIKLADVIELNAESDAILLYLAYGEYGVDYTISGSEIVMNNGREPRTISEVADCLSTIKISNVITIDGDSPALMQAIKDWTLDDFNQQEKINSLKLSDVIEIDVNDVNTPNIMKAIKDYSIGELGGAISELTIEEMIGEVDKSATILYALKDCTIDTLSTTIGGLSIQDLFYDQVYEHHLLSNNEKTVLTESGDINNIPLYVKVAGGYDTYDYSEHGAIDEIDDVYTDYAIAYDGTKTVYENGYTNGAYKGVRLYAYEDGEYVDASEVTGWALPADVIDDDLYYYDGVNYTLATKDGEGYYTESVLYYLDENEEVAEIKLVPERLGIKTGYEGKVLFATMFVAQKTGDEYENANLYYYDIEKQTYTRVEATFNEATRKFTASTTKTLFTHGNPTGIWKYLLMDSEKGCEVITSINNIGEQISDACDNINNATVYMLIEDGLITVEGNTVDDDLATEVNHDGDSSTPKVKLGDLTIGEMMTYIFNNLHILAPLS